MSLLHLRQIFFFNDTATTEIYTLSLHDALPICGTIVLITHKLDEVMDVSDTVTVMRGGRTVARMRTADTSPREIARAMRSEEHTSELQSRQYLVCRLLLEKKNKDIPQFRDQRHT